MTFKCYILVSLSWLFTIIASVYIANGSSNNPAQNSSHAEIILKINGIIVYFKR